MERSVPERTVRLRDGRALGYAEFGDPAGRPLLYFHGFPGSRIEAALGDAEARARGVRLVGVDRPGIGLSDFLDERSIPDWPADVVELADAMSFDRFAVVGVSGGGPYALACAWKLPDRLEAACVIGGLGPWDGSGAVQDMMGIGRFALSLPQNAPWAVQPLFQAAAWGIRAQSDAMVDFLAGSLPEPDRTALGDPYVARVLAGSYREAVRQGGRGASWEIGLYSGPWGFRLEDIAMQVDLWHGERDSVVPVAMGRLQAQAIPRCRARILPEEGHFSLPIRRMGEILDTLLP